MKIKKERIMKEDRKQIQELINKGLVIIDKMRNITTGVLAGNNTKELIKVIRSLFPLIQNHQPIISDILAKATLRLNDDGIINAFYFGDVRTSLKVLQRIYCRQPKIFISHKSEDEPFVDALVNLLRLYIGSEADKIFCSSVPNYKIGIGKEIFPEIKSKFEEYEVFMIIVHSPRYYQSSICLNEMGAAWIQKTECCSFLTADCEYNDLEGVIDKQIVSIKVNAKDAKDRMNEFLGKVLEFFNLPNLDFSSFSQWETDRNNFLENVCKLNLVVEQEKEAEENQESILESFSDYFKERLIEWANSDDGECWTTDSLDGFSVQIGNEEFFVNNGRERAEWDDFFERLIKIGFAVVDRTNSCGSPIYKLKKSAYDYLNSEQNHSFEET